MKCAFLSVRRNVFSTWRIRSAMIVHTVRMSGAWKACMLSGVFIFFDEMHFALTNDIKLLLRTMRLFESASHAPVL